MNSLGRKETGRNDPGEHFLSNGLLRNREAQGVSTFTLGRLMARALSLANNLPRRWSHGIPEGYSGRKLYSHYRCGWTPVGQQ
jgi:hypothetical protein